jgi:bifunctional non-homologous end joining protein LigD
VAGRQAPLDEYREKRDFGATSEPSGKRRRRGRSGTGPPRFVVQEHHATSLHWDLRLERDGVLASWAVPKGIPPDPETNHLAVHTEDHPIEYLDFEGDIPAGEYGAGTMSIWDRGVYEVQKWSDREVMVVFHGERVSGRYVLFATADRNWMIHRMDPPSDPDRQPLPTGRGLEPMGAIAGALPTGAGWVFEPWWPGQRMVVAFDGGRPLLAGGTRVPELNALGEALGSLSVVLDGVLVAVADDGRPDRARLQRRLAASSASALRRLAGRVPLTFAIVDVLWLDGRSRTATPLEERRALLESAVSRGAAWVLTPRQADGPALLEASSATGFGGVLAKRLGSPYRVGEVSPDWVAVRGSHA